MRQVLQRNRYVFRLMLAVAVCGLDVTGPILAQDAPARGRQARPADGPWFGEPLPPLADRLDVVEPTA